MKVFKSDNSQSVFDVAMLQYGGLQGLALLLADNPGLILEDGTVSQFGISYLVENEQAKPDELQTAGAQNAVPERIDQRPTYYSNVQQTVFDVALMQYGSVGGLAQLLADNPGLIQESGTIKQFRIAHKITPSFASDRRLKPKMLALVPASEGTTKSGQPWITEAGNPWITVAGNPWITK